MNGRYSCGNPAARRISGRLCTSAQGLSAFWYPALRLWWICGARTWLSALYPRCGHDCAQRRVRARQVVFKRIRRKPWIFHDCYRPGTKVEVDLLPGGDKVDSGPLTLPVPRVVSSSPQFLTLQTLISTKLSTHIGRGIQRAQDYADVVHLISVNQLGRYFGVEDAVRETYRKLWDEMHESRPRLQIYGINIRTNQPRPITRSAVPLRFLQTGGMA